MSLSINGDVCLFREVEGPGSVVGSLLRIDRGTSLSRPRIGGELRISTPPGLMRGESCRVSSLVLIPFDECA